MRFTICVMQTALLRIQDRRYVCSRICTETPYYYSVYGSENEVEETRDKKKVLVLGSGPIRIGQGIEFDLISVLCTVHGHLQKKVTRQLS